MKTLILSFFLSLMLAANGQVAKTKLRTYSALGGDVQEAFIEKINLKQKTTEKISLGKYASIIIDYAKQTLTYLVLLLTDIPALWDQVQGWVIHLEMLFPRQLI